MTNLQTATLRLNIDTLKGAMAAKGISGNEQLSRAIGVPLSTVKRIMSGSQQPSPVFLASVSLRLNVPLGLIAIPTVSKAVA